MLRVSLTFEPTHRVHLGQSFAALARGTYDPLFRSVPTPSGRIFWATAREQGVGIVARFARAPGPDLRAPIKVTLWAARQQPDAPAGSPSPASALEAFAARLPGWVGEYDHWSPFTTSVAWGQLPARLRRARAEAPGLRLPSIGLLSQNLFLAITEQRVTGLEAMGGMRSLLRQYGTPAPATGAPDQPSGLTIFPPPRLFAEIPDWAYHRAGYDRSRATTMVTYARRADSCERFAAVHSVGELALALNSIPGIGPWTIAETLQRYCGHPDAISVGDFHLARQVTYVFDGTSGDDARMVKLLTPYSGHRQRVIALIKAARLGEPRRAPRYAPHDIRTM